jgi:hypothetical protein
VAETPDKETHGDKPPEAPQQGASSRVPAIVVCLSALAVIGAATANFLPSFDRFPLPNFSLPNFSQFSLPNFDRFAPQSPHKTASAPIPKASVPIPDPVISATLKDIQLSQQQNAAVLVSLTQGSANQQADLKKISRQLTSLAAQTDALQNAMLTTSSIPHSNPRARVARTSPKPNFSPLPKPLGPVSVGGAPLTPTPAPGSRAG